MNKEELIEIIQELLRTDRDLEFLQKLDKDDLETLVALIRDRMDQAGE